MDFRANAAENTFRHTQDSSGAALANLGESGCLEVAGGRRVHCLIEIPFVVFSLLALLAILAVCALSAMNIWTVELRMTVLLIGFFVSLVTRMIKSVIVKTYLRFRSNGLLAVFKDMPSVNVGIENAATHERIKLVIEDEGVCLLDAAQRRLLIEGCSYRYAIYARDVYSIAPVSGYAMSGARMKCRMAGGDFDVVLKVRGHGPIASLVQSFSPATGAGKLATTLNRTLFGVETTTYQQTALPPALPSS